VDIFHTFYTKKVNNFNSIDEFVKLEISRWRDSHHL